MEEQIFVYICPTCNQPLRKPGYLGRSFCKQCEDYVPAKEVEVGANE